MLLITRLNIILVLLILCLLFPGCWGSKKSQQSDQLPIGPPKVNFEGVRRSATPSFYSSGQKAWILVDAPKNVSGLFRSRIQGALMQEGYQTASQAEVIQVLKYTGRSQYVVNPHFIEPREFYNAASDLGQLQGNGVIVYAKLSCFKGASADPSANGYYKSQGNYLKAVNLSGSKMLWNISIDSAISVNLIEQSTFISRIADKFEDEIQVIHSKTTMASDKDCIQGMDRLAQKLLERLNTIHKASINNKKIALLFWEPRDLSATKQAVCGQWIYHELLNALTKYQDLSKHTLVHRDNYERVLNEKQIQFSRRFDDETIVKIGKEVAANVGLAISVQDLGDSVRLYPRYIGISQSIYLPGIEAITIKKCRTCY